MLKRDDEAKDAFARAAELGLPLNSTDDAASNGAGNKTAESSSFKGAASPKNKSEKSPLPGILSVLAIFGGAFLLKRKAHARRD